MNEWRQLDLLKGKRQKGKLPPGPTEFQIHCAVADYLRAGKSKGWLWFHPPNGGERPAIYRDGTRRSPEGGRLQRMGARAGVSDIVLASPPYARMHVLELKRKGEKPSPEQWAFMDEVVICGGVARWADNVDAALEILREWGAVRAKVTRPEKGDG